MKADEAEIILGVDLAVDPAKTFVAVTEWCSGQVHVADVRGGCDDERLRDFASLGRIGIDCPLGWPDAFVEFVVRAQEGIPEPIAEGEGTAWRRTLTLRHTDEFVYSTTGRRPLSVSTDKLGVVALRAASLLALIRGSDAPVVKDGSDPRVVEVYPAAALRAWGIDHRGYKQEISARARVIADVERQLPLTWAPGLREVCVAVDHALDALIAALATRSVAIGAYHRPPAELEAHARREGWIAIPSGGLAGLAS